jgi:hypothetical protein
MTELFFQLLIGLFAVYGFIQLAINVFNGIKLKFNRDDGIKLIITFKNRQDKVEGAIRSIFLNGVLDRIGADSTLYVADMGSTDDTPKIIHNLCNQYNNLKTINVRENEVIIQ